jgi:predicted  nucleic acid-binding Zn-ribbon protein
MDNVLAELEELNTERDTLQSDLEDIKERNKTLNEKRVAFAARIRKQITDLAKLLLGLSKLKIKV